MNREDTKKAIEVMQAWLDGGTVQCRGSTVEWVDCGGNIPLWQWGVMEYRIKPEPREFWVRSSDMRAFHPYSTLRNEPHIRVREVLDD